MTIARLGLKVKVIDQGQRWDWGLQGTAIGSVHGDAVGLTSILD